MIPTTRQTADPSKRKPTGRSITCLLRTRWGCPTRRLTDCPLQRGRSLKTPIQTSGDDCFGTPGVTRTDPATAAPMPQRCSTPQALPGWSARPLARFTPAASTTAAVSTLATRLPVLVQTSGAHVVGIAPSGRLLSCGRALRPDACYARTEARRRRWSDACFRVEARAEPHPAGTEIAATARTISLARALRRKAGVRISAVPSSSSLVLAPRRSSRTTGRVVLAPGASRSPRPASSQRGSTRVPGPGAREPRGGGWRWVSTRR
jgi:hypothetical protein